MALHRAVTAVLVVWVAMSAHPPPTRAAAVTRMPAGMVQRGGETSFEDWDSSQVESLFEMFSEQKTFNSDLNKWDVSRVSNMNETFAKCSKFNSNLNSWDVTSVTSLHGTFYLNEKFNTALGSWQTSSVTSMEATFRNCDVFAQDLDSWQTSEVTTMYGMFSRATNFNSDLNGWNVANVENTRYLFNKCRVFNSNLNSWQTSSVTDLLLTFDTNSLFNGNIADWEVSGITDFQQMFYQARSFNQDVSRWNVGKAESLAYMFEKAVKFNQDISRWQTGKVESLTGAFAQTLALSANLTGWNTSSLTDGNMMNSGYRRVNPNASIWNSSLLVLPSEPRGPSDDPDTSIVFAENSYSAAGPGDYEGLDASRVFLGFKDHHEFAASKFQVVLEPKATSLVFVDPETGTWQLAPKTSHLGGAKSKTFVATLLGTDQDGNGCPLKKWSFVVVPKPVFETTAAWKSSSDGLAKLRQKTSYYARSYTSGSTYTLASPGLPRQTMLQGYADRDHTKISFSLHFANESDAGQAAVLPFYVNNDGQTLAQPQEAQVGKYKAKLVATDAKGNECDVYSWTFTIKPKPIFKTTVEWQAEGVAKLASGASNYASDYTVGETYTLASPSTVADQKKIFRDYFGDADKITYSMVFKDAAAGTIARLPFYVNAHGETLASPRITHVGAYVARLVAADAAGNTADVYSWTFNIRTKPDFAVDSKVWNSSMLSRNGSYLANYTIGATYELMAPPLSRDVLFQHYAAEDASAISYSVSFESPGSSKERRQDSAAKDSSPGKFFVDGSGEILARPNRLGRYVGSLRAHDGAGSVALVKRWTFSVIEKDTANMANGPNGAGCQNGGTMVDTVEMDEKFTCDCVLVAFTGDNCEALTCGEGQIPLAQECQDCAAGSNATLASDDCGTLGGPCCYVPKCPSGCLCVPQDKLASQVRVECKGEAWLEEPLPEKTSQLVLDQSSADFASKLRSSAALAARTEEQPIILTISSKALPAKPKVVALATSAAEPVDTNEAKADVKDDGPSSAEVLAQLCTDADTKLPGSLQVAKSFAAVCTGKNCSNTANDDNSAVCQPGSFATPDGLGCRECEAGGFFLEQAGRTGWYSHCTCDLCNPGTYSNASGASDEGNNCRVCPQGTNTSALAGYRACPCLEGSSRTDRFGPCSSCLENTGIECYKDYRKTRPGYHWTFASTAMLERYRAFAENLLLEHDYNGSLTMFDGDLPPAYPCPLSDHCLGGIDSACSDGTTGPLCEVCTDDYFRFNGDCRECPPTTGGAVATMLFIALLALVIGFFVVRCNAKAIAAFAEESAKEAIKATEVMLQIKKRARASAINSGEVQGEENMSFVDAYTLQVTMALSDGQYNENEMRQLQASREKMGVTEEQHELILKDVMESVNKKPWHHARRFTLFKIAVEFTQVFGMITTVYTGIQWTDSFRTFSSTVSVLAANPFQILMPACVDRSMVLDAYTQFRVALIFPFVGVLAVGMFYKIKSLLTEEESAYCKRHTCTRHGCTNGKFSGDWHCNGTECKPFQNNEKPSDDNVCLHQSADGKKCRAPRMVTGMRLLRAMCIFTVALLYFVIYPTITVNSVRILAECHSICTDVEYTNCTSYMRSDYSLSCDTSTHASYVVFAGIIFAIVGIGTPALLGHTLWKHRRNFLKQSPDSLYFDPVSTPSAFAMGFGFFYKPFKSSLIYWEAVGQTYKLFLTAIITFIAPGTPMQVFVGIVFSGFFWMLDAVFQPFENKIENILQTFARGVVFLTLVIGGMMQTSRVGASGGAGYKSAAVDDEAAGVVLVVINASVFVAVAILFYLNQPKDEILASIKCCMPASEEQDAGPQRKGSTIMQRKGSTIQRRGSTGAQSSVRRAGSSGEPEAAGGYLTVGPDEDGSTANKGASVKKKSSSVKKKAKGGSTKAAKAGSTKKKKGGSTKAAKAGSTKKKKGGSTKKKKAGSTKKVKAGGTKVASAKKKGSTKKKASTKSEGAVNTDHRNTTADSDEENMGFGFDESDDDN